MTHTLRKAKILFNEHARTIMHALDRHDMRTYRVADELGTFMLGPANVPVDPAATCDVYDFVLVPVSEHQYAIFWRAPNGAEHRIYGPVGEPLRAAPGGARRKL